VAIAFTPLGQRCEWRVLAGDFEFTGSSGDGERRFSRRCYPAGPVGPLQYFKLNSSAQNGCGARGTAFMEASDV
jgi:hypothetical protein